jgi:short-subunit dehydrogenase
VPTYSIYNAGKFGARGFMAGMRRELRGTGVAVSEIFPGSVDTEFAADSRVMWETRNVTPSFALASPRVVAERILQLIRSQRKYAVIPGIMWLVIWADAIFPSFVSWVLSRFFYTRDGVRYSWGRDPK